MVGNTNYDYQTSHEDELTITDIANFFLLKEPMTQKKIQKLCYYSYAWFLALHDEELVKGCEFEAWVHGPVNYELRKVFGCFGWQELKIDNQTIESTRETLFKKIDESLVYFLESVWLTYGDKSGDELERLTHSEKPWLEQREGLSIYERSNNVISKKTMKEFYLSISI